MIKLIITINGNHNSHAVFLKNILFYRNFNRLSRQLKDKGWDIIDTTRVKVDAFRRTLPLIGDLKNPCMRERHWDRIKDLMGV